ncbi:hypothetical protein BIV60_21485 [Bacillus sp. MUM 116]|uniref:hypothetical protein n=1 Tax=Bacillus sp. MUM 116 TaxID=1678002 RepID=UPI0008F576E9|nr:hypothetical protein [Bacillus sp. MUM 116]OIK10419.1 hypothetical protein BIV60_21485 [Bacillus sp. MUM 116]
MIHLHLENISINSMKKVSGIFLGKKNTLKQFRYESVQNEAVGAFSGDKNKVIENYWVKNKENWEGD